MIVEAPIPDWEKLEQEGIIPEGSSTGLKRLTSSKDNVFVKELLRAQPELVSTLIETFRKPATDDYSKVFLLHFLYDNCRQDSSLWEIFVKPQSDALISVLDLNLERDASPNLVEIISIFLTGMLAHSAIPVETALIFLPKIASKCSREACMESFANLLKRPEYRREIWNIDFPSRTIMACISGSAATHVLYLGLRCLWLLTFDKDLARDVNARFPIIPTITDAVRINRSEKVVRLWIAICKNCVTVPDAASHLLETGVSQYVQQLEFEKWKDQEIYTEQKDLHSCINELGAAQSNLDRYVSELASGKLRWSFIHSDRFWVENAMSFEAKNYHVIRQLVDLLKCAKDPETLAVACFDIGEFARFNPMGRKVLNQSDAKALIMGLMTAENRDVAREALLCTQKLMLNNWQKVQ